MLLLSRSFSFYVKSKTTTVSSSRCWSGHSSTVWHLQ